jgi:hypothetical protein
MPAAAKDFKKLLLSMPITSHGLISASAGPSRANTLKILDFLGCNWQLRLYALLPCFLKYAGLVMRPMPGCHPEGYGLKLLYW